MSELLIGALAGKRILLMVTGSIAAYKAPTLARQLTDAGATVRVVMTEAAGRFVGAAVFRGLGLEVHTDMWQGAGPSSSGELHVELAEWADALVVCPASADSLARLRSGRSDDLLGATALCADSPVFVVPAMHPNMWGHAATQENADVLRRRGVRFLGPTSGVVASGAVGVGRMEEPEEVVRLLAGGLDARSKPLTGRHFVITAGPTREPLDPVRTITNISSGKMGYALAAVAFEQGAEVTLISGPVALRAPAGVELVSVVTAAEMEAVLGAAMGDDLRLADCLIMAAAVCDFRPLTLATEKLKRTSEAAELMLVPNPDILAGIGRRRSALRPVLVGFALETAPDDELIALGRQKLIKKQVDLIVANAAEDSLGKDENVARLVSARDCLSLDKMSKVEVARHIIAWVTSRLQEPESADTTH